MAMAVAPQSVPQPLPPTAPIQAPQRPSGEATLMASRKLAASALSSLPAAGAADSKVAPAVVPVKQAGLALTAQPLKATAGPKAASTPPTLVPPSRPLPRPMPGPAKPQALAPQPLKPAAPKPVVPSAPKLGSLPPAHDSVAGLSPSAVLPHAGKPPVTAVRPTPASALPIRSASGPPPSASVAPAKPALKSKPGLSTPLPQTPKPKTVPSAPLAPAPVLPLVAASAPKGLLPSLRSFAPPPHSPSSTPAPWGPGVDLGARGGQLYPRPTQAVPLQELPQELPHLQSLLTTADAQLPPDYLLGQSQPTNFSASEMSFEAGFALPGSTWPDLPEWGLTPWEPAATPSGTFSDGVFVSAADNEAFSSSLATRSEPDFTPLSGYDQEFAFDPFSMSGVNFGANRQAAPVAPYFPSADSNNIWGGGLDSRFGDLEWVRPEARPMNALAAPWVAQSGNGWQWSKPE